MEQIYFEIAADQAPLDELLIRQEEHQKVQQEIALLKEAYQRVIVMRLNNHMSFKEIAEELHISESNARVRYFRAVEQIKGNINIEWGDCVEEDS